MTFEEIYQKVQNPLDDDQNLNKLIDMYKQSKRMGYKMESMEIHGINPDPTKRKKSLYSNIASPSSKDLSQYNKDDKEKFMKHLYKSWMKHMLSLTAEQKSKASKHYTDLEGLIEVLEEKGEVNSFADVKQLKENPLVQKNNVEYWQSGVFNHIFSDAVSGYTKRINKITHRLYLGAEYKDVYKLVDEFGRACTQNGIPYYFKFDAARQNREDTIIIYSDDDNFTNYINILNEIKQKNPDLKFRKPSLVAGNYDNWLGIADEPLGIYELKDPKGKFNPSATQTRAAIIEESMDLVLADEYNKYLNNKRQLKCNGKAYSVNALFRSKLLGALRDEVKCPYDAHLYINYEELSEQQKKQARQEFIDLINRFSDDDLNKMVQMFRDNAAKRWESQVGDEYIHKKIGGKHVSINSQYKNKPCEWGITPRIVDYAMKNMVDVFKEANPHFTQDVRKKIKQVCASQSHQLDADKFAFNNDTRERMNNRVFTRGC